MNWLEGSSTMHCGPAPIPTALPTGRPDIGVSCRVVELIVNPLIPLCGFVWLALSPVLATYTHFPLLSASRNRGFDWVGSIGTGPPVWAWSAPPVPRLYGRTCAGYVPDGNTLPEPMVTGSLSST